MKPEFNIIEPRFNRRKRKLMEIVTYFTTLIFTSLTSTLLMINFDIDVYITFIYMVGMIVLMDQFITRYIDKIYVIGSIIFTPENLVLLPSNIKIDYSSIRHINYTGWSSTSSPGYIAHRYYKFQIRLLQGNSHILCIQYNLKKQDSHFKRIFSKKENNIFSVIKKNRIKIQFRKRIYDI